MLVRPTFFAMLAAGALLAGAAQAQTRDSAVTNASITVLDPGQMSHDADLAIADVTRPAKGSKTATAEEASYTVVGLGGEAYSISTPSTVTLTRDGGAEEIKLTLHPSRTVGAFTGPAGQPASAKVEVQGSLPVSADAKTGVYKGQYDVTVAFP
ncbi:DUF4402 domain-containing protein [Phenylobacterium sp. J367]|uniref:DUF4402 domain-containing protein n=1 Tax=Phenylobacterium sp. J367 TaxID=2898435 RepID=UPI0021519FE7|nr:DUF4402 domain-containing protein [Phenylobacterium sp. J367]MCR5880503.1 DUF4402 domain-containing protein [Phenylobacterium sp. J367]